MSERRTRSAYEKRNRVNEREKPRGFDRGLEFEGILGATSNKETTYYLVKWKDCEELDLLSSDAISETMPEVLIDYHEKRTNIWERVHKRNMDNVPITNLRPPVNHSINLFPKTEMEVDAVVNEPV